jgi:hypothetical protein
MPATSQMREKLVHCDVQELKCVPVYEETAWIALKGTAGQVSFAGSIRTKKLDEWRPDLPQHVWKALTGIADATWWLANQKAESSDIGWPQSWVAVEEPRQPDLLSQPSSLNEARSKVIGALPAKPIPSEDIEKFEAFAKMACRSPEMSYMTMMALLYRQTKDPRVLQMYRAARDKVDGYISGIEQILGIPKNET